MKRYLVMCWDTRCEGSNTPLERRQCGGDKSEGKIIKTRSMPFRITTKAKKTNVRSRQLVLYS